MTVARPHKMHGAQQQQQQHPHIRHQQHLVATEQQKRTEFSKGAGGVIYSGSISPPYQSQQVQCTDMCTYILYCVAQMYTCKL